MFVHGGFFYLRCVHGGDLTTKDTEETQRPQRYGVFAMFIKDSKYINYFFVCFVKKLCALCG
jgi:hypothetical protein